MQLAHAAEPRHATPPGTAHSFSVQLNASGSITLAWHADDAPIDSGVYFTVRRTLPGRTAATFLGGTGGRQFTDDTIPPGTTHATYTVQSSRDGARGATSEPFVVRFTASHAERAAA